MGDLDWPLAGVMPLLSSGAWEPWPDAPDDLLARTASLCRPLVRALLLAGYQTKRISVARADETVVSTDSSLAVTHDGPDPPLDTVPGAGAGVVLDLSSLYHDSAAYAAANGQWLDPRAGDPDLDPSAVFTHALPLTAASGYWAGLAPGAAGQVPLWSASDLLSDAWLAEIDASLGAIVADIMQALEGRVAAGSLTPLSQAGLLWLFNPLFWYARDVTFPGQQFQLDDSGAAATLPWPAVLSPTALGYDPVAVLSQEPRAGDHDVDEVIVGAAGLVASLSARSGEVLGGLAYHDRPAPGDLRSLMKPDRSFLAPTGARHVAYSLRRLSGDQLADAALHDDWLDVLIQMADKELITPAGYPLPVTSTGGDTPADDEFTDPVRPVYYPAAGTTAERVVLEVAGLVAVVVSATGLCEVPLVQAFAWDYLEADSTYPLTLLVVAGPGVEIIPGYDRGALWELEVFRVWDYASIPVRGSRVQPELVLAPHPVVWEPDDPERVQSWMQGMPLYGMRVYPKPDGVVLEYPMPIAPDQQPSWRITATAPANSGAERIAYSIVFGHPDTAGPLEPSLAAMTMWVSASVEVTYEAVSGEHAPAPTAEPQVWRIADTSKIPLQGATLPYTGVNVASYFGPPLPQPTVAQPPDATAVDLDPVSYEWVWDLLMDACDVAIGQIPFVGDLVDATELTLWLFTGTDKWGRPMSGYEALWMAGALLVPFVSSAMARDALHGADDVTGFALELSRGQNEALLGYLTGLWSVLPEDDDLMTSLTEALAQSSRAYIRFKPGYPGRINTLKEIARIPEWIGAADAVGRATSEYLDEVGRMHLVDLLTEEIPAIPFGSRPGLAGRHFRPPVLDGAYERFCEREGIPADSEAILRFIREATGAPRAILEMLIGNVNVARLAEDAIRAPRVAEHWNCLGRLFWSHALGMDARYYEQEAGAVDRVLALAENIAETLQDEQRPLDFAQPDELPGLSARVCDLLANVGYSPAQPMPADGMVRLLGRSMTMQPQDLAEALMRGMKELDTRIVAIANDTGITSLTTEAYLRIIGSESFFKDLLTLSGYQYSSLFEVEVAAEEFVRQVNAGELFPERMFALQPMIGGEKGPDLIRLVMEDGEPRIQIVESKSWANIWRLTHPGGPLLEQIERFIALDEMGHRYSIGGNLYETSRTIIIRADPEQYALMRHQPREASLAQFQAEIDNLQGELDIICQDTGFTVRIDMHPLYVIWENGG